MLSGQYRVHRDEGGSAKGAFRWRPQPLIPLIHLTIIKPVREDRARHKCARSTTLAREIRESFNASGSETNRVRSNGSRCPS